MKILDASTETQYNQIHKFFKSWRCYGIGIWRKLSGTSRRDERTKKGWKLSKLGSSKEGPHGAQISEQGPQANGFPQSWDNCRLDRVAAVGRKCCCPVKKHSWKDTDSNRTFQGQEATAPSLHCSLSPTGGHWQKRNIDGVSQSQHHEVRFARWGWSLVIRPRYPAHCYVCSFGWLCPQ